MKRLAILAFVLALASCKKSDNAAPPPPAGSGSAPAMGSGSAAPAAGSGSAAAPAPAPEAAVPTEQDFEGQAKKDIDDKNVEAKVKAIETDLGGGT